MDIQKILSADEIEYEHGDFYKFRISEEFDINDVPEKLKPLLPYAMFWGDTDDSYQTELLKKVPDDILKNLRYVVSQFIDELDEWLAGPAASSQNPSDAYCAYSAMRIASDYVRRR